MNLGKILFIITFSLLFIIRVYFKLKYDHLISLKHLSYEPLYIVIFRYILGIILILSIIHYLFFNNIFNFILIDYNKTIRLIGFIIAIISLVFLFITHEYLGNNFSTTVEVKENSRVVKEGPYKYIRHPMYLSYFVLFIASFFIMGHILFSISGILIILSLMTKRLEIEERNLINKFGIEYINYMKVTGKFIPFLQKGGKIINEYINIESELEEIK